jgi:hypothetical protein
MGVPAAAYAERRQAHEPAQPAARRSAGPARTPAAAVSLAFASQGDEAGVAKLPIGFLVEAALDMLDRAGLHHGGTIEDLRLQLKVDVEVQTKPDLHERAERLVRTLHRVGGAPVALAALADAKKAAQLYLPAIAERIAGHAQEVRNLYIRAIWASYMAMPDVADGLLADAEAGLHGFPLFVVDQYLGPAGVEKLLKEVGGLADQIEELREQSGNPPRALDQLIGMGSKWERTKAEIDLGDALEQARDLREAGAGLDQLADPIQAMTAQAEQLVGATSALALYEQFSAWRRELQGSYLSALYGLDPFEAALDYEYKFSGIVFALELAMGESPQRAREDNAAATRQLVAFVTAPHFQEAVDLIHTRQESIALSHAIFKGVVVLLAAIATGGAASWAAGELVATLEGAAAVGAEGGAIVETAGLGRAVVMRVAGTAAFTETQRVGTQLAFGEAPGSFAADFVTNLTLGVTAEGAGAFYKSLVSIGEDAGPALRALYALGEKASELGAVLGLGELEHEATEHRLMSGGEVAEAVGVTLVGQVIGGAAAGAERRPGMSDELLKAKLRLTRAEGRMWESKRRAEMAGAREQEAAADVARAELVLARAKRTAAEAADALASTTAEQARAEQLWQQAPKGKRQEPWRAVQRARSKAAAAREAAERAPRSVAEAESRVARTREALDRRAGLARKAAWALDDAQSALRRAKALFERRSSGQETLAEQARRQWMSGLREEEALELGARSGEHLHHAIELDVLDEFPDVFTAAELNSIENMRVIPSEITPEEATLLDIARSTPPEHWPPEVAERVELRPAGPGGGGGPREIPFLKERPAKGRPVQLHNAWIRSEWDKTYAELNRNLDRLEASGIPRDSDDAHAYARRFLIERRDTIDHLVGQFFGGAREAAGLRPARGG